MERLEECQDSDCQGIILGVSGGGKALTMEGLDETMIL